MQYALPALRRAILLLSLRRRAVCAPMTKAQMTDIFHKTTACTIGQQ
jgi:hypothetical protein